MTSAVVDREPPWLDLKYGSTCYGPRGLPAVSIGRQAIAWGMQWLTIPDGDLAGSAWVPTPEQARFAMWWFALDAIASTPSKPRWLYRRAMLRRLKGAGKDPLAAWLCLVSLVGPAVPAWDAVEGVWYGVPHKAPHIQIAAVSQEQTNNTGDLFNGMLPAKTRAKYGLTVTATMVTAPHGKIKAMTNSPLSAEGPRPFLAVANEPQNWFASNNGHLMHRVMRRNLTKVGGRLLYIGNAPGAGQDSVAEQIERAYHNWRSGKTKGDIRLLYDSREAPADTRLDDEELLRAGLVAARGDSWWIDLDDLMTEIWSTDTTPSDSRRFYLNLTNAAEDAWVDPNHWRALSTGFAVPAGADVVVFADLSKSRDATALMVCDIDTGHVSTIGVWAKPHDVRPDKWQVNRDEVMREGLAAMKRWKVKAFYADPGSGEDEEGKKYWDSTIDIWSAALDVAKDVMPASPTGDLRHRVRWDMRNHMHTRQFTAAAERTRTDIEDGEFTNDGHPLLNQHVFNAKLRPNDYGVSMGKEHGESSFLVDAAVAMVGARMMRLQYIEWVRTRRIPRPGMVSGVRYN